MKRRNRLRVGVRSKNASMLGLRVGPSKIGSEIVVHQSQDTDSRLSLEGLYIFQIQCLHSMD